MSKHFSGEPDPRVHNITDARIPHSDDMHRRMVQYAMTMSIRVICLILIFFVGGWMRIVCIVGAIVLPYFAVILANRGSDTGITQGSEALLDHAPNPELLPGTGTGRDEETPLRGEVIDDAGPNPYTAGNETATWYQGDAGTWYEGDPATWQSDSGVGRDQGAGDRSTEEAHGNRDGPGANRPDDAGRADDFRNGRRTIRGQGRDRRRHHADHGRRSDEWKL